MVNYIDSGHPQPLCQAYEKVKITISDYSHDFDKKYIIEMGQTQTPGHTRGGTRRTIQGESFPRRPGTSPRARHPHKAKGVICNLNSRYKCGNN